MISLQSLRDILKNVNYKNWKFIVGDMGDGYFLQVAFHSDDNIDIALQKGRKWYVSPHSCHSEIVLTAWMAVQAAEIHEARENFRYKSKQIFGPHINVEALASVCDMRDVRDESDMVVANEHFPRRSNT